MLFIHLITKTHKSKGNKSIQAILYLAKINEIPDLIISSSALRALQTMENAISAGKWESKIKVEKEIYHASVSSLIDLIKKLKIFIPIYV